jgi:hypothetical protein
MGDPRPHSLCVELPFNTLGKAVDGPGAAAARALRSSSMGEKSFRTVCYRLASTVDFVFLGKNTGFFLLIANVYSMYAVSRGPRAIVL